MSLMMGAGFVVNAAVQLSVNSDNNCDAKDANFLSIEEFARPCSEFVGWLLDWSFLYSFNGAACFAMVCCGFAYGRPFKALRIILSVKTCFSIRTDAEGSDLCWNA